ncbi:MAG: glycosyltransferase family 4 protein [Planctomycetota bacterium]|nr:glycosyltransferase family 4 protein [Planctomycetota bacterium]MDG2144624.1 glycosyltransferase family 4 protein [Planctomycetota bacterium]
MKLLMVSGDRQTPVGEVGPFHTMQERFSTHFERIDVLCPQPPRAVTTKTIHGNVHFHPANCGRLGMRSYIAKRGTELIEQHGHDLIVSHDYGWFYNGLGSAAISKRTGVPYVSEIHHVPGFPRAADRREVFDKLIARRYINWAKSRATAFRVVNHKEMPPLLQSWGVPKSKILVLGSLYIDLDLFSPFSDLEEAVDGISPKKWDLVFVGRLVNNKGLITIIDALYQLKYRMRPLKLLIVGRGPMRAAVEERVKKHELEKHVEFVEWLETPKDLADVYRASRAILCASTCEGGPRVTVEAMACGTPAVSTPVGIMGELIEDGKNGALCRFDYASLAASIERVISDEVKLAEMGVRARADVLKFEYDEAIAGYANGLKGLVGK